MSYMSALDQAGISVRKMSSYIDKHPGIDFDDAVTAIETKRHTGRGNMKDLQEQKNIAWAAATDAANRHMKSHGRKAWSDADYNYAVAEFNRLLPGEREG